MRRSAVSGLGESDSVAESGHADSGLDAESDGYSHTVLICLDHN